jgi:hypothetical protein
VRPLEPVASICGVQWFGLRWRSIRLGDLIAGRWPSPKAALVDGLLGATLWAVWFPLAEQYSASDAERGAHGVAYYGRADAVVVANQAKPQL